MASGQIVPLSELTPATKRVTICARVSRMWDYFTKERELAHVDLVLIDEEGTKMYAEIAGVQGPKFKDLLVEGQVYLIRDFFVQSAKRMFRAVEGKFMIKTTPWTKVEQKTVVPPSFPRYAYCLTEFDRLPHFIGKKDSFLDALGIIVAISDLLTVRLPGQPHESSKRNLRLVDINGRMIDVALWGHHAVTFDGAELYKKGQSNALIILLVGTLMKDYRGHETISCGEAAKYYINPDIPEVASYRQSLGEQLPVIEWIAGTDDRYQKAYKRNDARPVKIEGLLSTDPNEFIGLNLTCTVTITKVSSPSWWFLACSRCHKTAYAANTEFSCSDMSCPSISAEPRYKLCMVGTDGTGEAEFVFFAGVAEQIIGKHVGVLVRAVARRLGVIPAEISMLVTQRYTLDVSIAEKGLQFGYIAFQVNNINTVHPRAKTFEFNTLAPTSSQLPAADSVPAMSSIPAVDTEVSITDQSAVLSTSTDIAAGSSQATPPPLTPSSALKEPSGALTDAGSGTKAKGSKRLLDEETKDAPIKKLFR